MHSDLSPHLHTPVCNELINKYMQCQKDNPFKRYLGECSKLDSAMIRCLKSEKEVLRQASHRKSEERKKRLAAQQLSALQQREGQV